MYVCTYMMYAEHSPISMAFFYPILVRSTLPANYLSDNSCEIPIVMKSSAKVAAESAATFEPMYV